MYKGRRLSDTDVSPRPSTALENTALYLDPRVLHHQVSQAHDRFCSPTPPPPLPEKGRGTQQGSVNYRNLKVEQPVEIKQSPTKQDR